MATSEPDNSSETTLEDHLRQFFAHAIRRREITGMRLAEEAGIHRTTISRWINGRISISLSTLDKMISALGPEAVLEFLQKRVHGAEGPNPAT